MLPTVAACTVVWNPAAASVTVRIHRARVRTEEIETPACVALTTTPEPPDLTRTGRYSPSFSLGDVPPGGCERVALPALVASAYAAVEALPESTCTLASLFYDGPFDALSDVLLTGNHHFLRVRLKRGDSRPGSAFVDVQSAPCLG